jgi:beta-galactosidase
MPTVTYNGQCFLIDQRRVFIVGAAMAHTRVPRDAWDERLAAIRQAGFNLVQTNCPWFLYEPRKGRFDDNAIHDLRHFIERCGAHDLYVMLQPGPFIGDGFDGGGFPHWLMTEAIPTLRDGNPEFVEYVNKYLRTLLSGLSDLQASKDGPLLLLQVEDGWTCGNQAAARPYMGAIVHIMHECGFTIPIVAANDLWVSADDISANFDAWRGRDHLLANLRQLRIVQPDAPRLVSAVTIADRAMWGHEVPAIPSAHTIVRQCAEVLAAGGHPIVTPFHGGISHDWLGGRAAGGPDRFYTTAPAAGAPLGEAGARTDRYLAIKRLVMFATQFGAIFADLEPDDQVVAVDMPDSDAGRKRHADPPSVVPLRGGQGEVTFVFPGHHKGAMTLLLHDGRRLSVTPGDTPVAWYVMDLDLQGGGRLDYANVSPWALLARKTLVMFAPARTEALLAINGRPFEATVPSGRTAVIEEHEQFRIVLLNFELLDATYVHDQHLYIGCAGLTVEGEPIAHPKFKTCTVVSPDGTMTKRPMSSDGRRTSTRTLHDVRAAPAYPYVNGTSPRFASLSGPSSLVECGAPFGYGWYRIALKKPSERKRTVLLPNAGDRAHLYVNGALEHMVGVGPGASNETFDLKLSADDTTMTFLVDNLGRFDGGNDLHDAKGIRDHLVEVTSFRGCKFAEVRETPVKPFDFRGYISGLPDGAVSDVRQFTWTFTHLRKSPVYMLVDALPYSGLLLLNDAPLTYYAGENGARSSQLLLNPADERFKRGRNIVRFAPDARQEPAGTKISKAVRFLEATELITEGAEWSFAKWEAPADADFEALAESQRAFKCPTWYAATFTTPTGDMPVWIDTTGLSKGCIIVNDHHIGRFFTSTATGKSVGPQVRLWIPRGWLLDDEDNRLLIFDEHGALPGKVRIVQRETGNLDV